MIESHQRSDFNLISDLLEYEVLPYIPAWKEIFGILSQRVVFEPVGKKSKACQMTSTNAKSLTQTQDMGSAKAAL
ncbi:MAG: hypothetical protein MZW92_12930 [Comamonadaceae bacterium]|nr:hypothetical protein [Comamonadaceae bacterium]